MLERSDTLAPMPPLAAGGRVLLVSVAFACGGCSLNEGAEIDRAAPAMARPGPVLVAEVVNRSDEERVFSYEFETADRSSTGSGEGVIPPCTSMVESWAEITGSYTLRLDDEVLVEDRLAAGQGDGAFIVVRVQVGDGGDLDVLPPALVAVSPPLGSWPLEGCR